MGYNSVITRPGALWEHEGGTATLCGMEVRRVRAQRSIFTAFPGLLWTKPLHFRVPFSTQRSHSFLLKEVIPPRYFKDVGSARGS